MFVYELWCSQISFLVLIALDQDAVNEENEFQRKYQQEQNTVEIKGKLFINIEVKITLQSSKTTQTPQAP